jgi:mannitol/fructose-specific phosphotransferase system IIA component (Ntr-type)
MPLTDLVAPNAVIPALKVTSKKQAIQELSARAARLSGQSERVIFETLLQREKLGRTASCPSWNGCSVCLPGSTARSISRRSTGSRWI